MSVLFIEKGPDSTPTINSLGSDTSHGAANLEDKNRNFYWKAGNANTSGSIDIDLGSVMLISGVALVGHNYSSTSVGIKVSYDDADVGDFASQTYLVGSSGAYHDYASINSGVWAEEFSSATSARYFRVYLEAMGASTYQQVGFICFSGFKHDVNYSFSSSNRGFIPGGEVGETTAGIRRRNATHDGRETFSYSWEYITEAHKEDFEDFKDDIRGGFYPFAFMDETGRAWYCQLTGLTITPVQYQLYNVTVNMEEDV